MGKEENIEGRIDQNDVLGKMDSFQIKKAAEEFSLKEMENMGKFEYSFAGLILGSLALSLQFSVKLGGQYVCLLIFSWVIYFLTAGIAGYRIFLLKRYMIEMSACARNNILNITGDWALLRDRTTLDECNRKLMLWLSTQVKFYCVALFYNFLFISLNLLKIKRMNVLVENSLILVGVILVIIVFCKTKKKITKPQS